MTSGFERVLPQNLQKAGAWWIWAIDGWEPTNRPFRPAKPPKTSSHKCGRSSLGLFCKDGFLGVFVFQFPVVACVLSPSLSSPDCHLLVAVWITLAAVEFNLSALVAATQPFRQATGTTTKYSAQPTKLNFRNGPAIALGLGHLV